MLFKNPYIGPIFFKNCPYIKPYMYIFAWGHLKPWILWMLCICCSLAPSGRDWSLLCAVAVIWLAISNMSKAMEILLFSVLNLTGEAKGHQSKGSFSGQCRLALGIMTHFLASGWGCSGSERVYFFFKFAPDVWKKDKKSEYIHFSIRINSAAHSILHFHFHV